MDRSAGFLRYNAATPPPTYLGPTSFGGITVSNSVPQDFWSYCSPMRAGIPSDNRSPRRHDLGVRNLPAAPSFILGNVYAPVGTTGVFASQNAGNPVTGGYSWQFNGGPALSDGATGHGGSTISGSSSDTRTSAKVQPGDYGKYTVNGANTDLSTNATGTLTGSASRAILSGQPPALESGLAVLSQRDR